MKSPHFYEPGIAVRLSLLAVLLFPAWPLLADDAERAAAFERCRTIAAGADRLLCYDTLVDGGVFDEEHLEQARIERFGDNDSQAVESGRQDEHIAVTVVRVSESETGTHYFYTANGQVWKHSGRGNWGLDVPFDARIETGFMGSYFLRTEGGKSARVKRVR